MARSDSKHARVGSICFKHFRSTHISSIVGNPSCNAEHEGNERVRFAAGITERPIRILTALAKAG